MLQLMNIRVHPNLLLMHDDILIVPMRPETVWIQGTVHSSLNYIKSRRI